MNGPVAQKVLGFVMPTVIKMQNSWQLQVVEFKLEQFAGNAFGRKVEPRRAAYVSNAAADYEI